MIIAGLDEAGRGPVIGPLIVAGLSCEPDKLKDIKVRDSKTLLPRARTILFEKLENVADQIIIKKIEAYEIDNLRKSMTLNAIELNAFAEIINQMHCKKVYVDAVDVNDLRFGNNLMNLTNNKYEIISEHKADSTYPIVSAASIIAKVTRDREIEKLKKIIGDFGSGYPSDPKTITFLKNYFKDHGSYPEHVRMSWKSITNLNTLDLYGL
ncbi:MAG: ribonuclease HII [Thermoplasmata archaeon]